MNTKSKYCPTCYKRIRHSKKCIICGESFINLGNGKYCNRCSQLANWASNKIRTKIQLNMDINISLHWLTNLALKTTHCPICGKELDYNANNGKGNHANYASIDRINNSNILTPENIWIICSKCNTTKSNRTLKEFIDYCTLVTEKFK